LLVEQGQPLAAAAALQSQEAGVKAVQRQGAKRRIAKRRGTRAALMLRPSGDYLAQPYVFGLESSRERRHYIRSYRSPPNLIELEARTIESRT